jgi:glutamate racemase
VASPPTILVFDSGLGGLTVLREIVRARPDAHYAYVADDAFFPYGHHGEDEIIARVVPLIGELIAAHRPDLVVIACNTASTLVMSYLREQYDVPFVGTVPAIKPACASSRTKRVSVLGTKGTVQREYTRALIRDFSQGCEVTLVGSPELASLAETALSGEAVRRRDRPNRAMLVGSAKRSASNRHRRAGLHALSAADDRLVGWRRGRWMVDPAGDCARVADC